MSDYNMYDTLSDGKLNRCIIILRSIASMPTDILMGKSLGSRISTYYYLRGKFVRYIVYVIFAFTYHKAVQQLWLIAHI